jgi:hypothetical protein
MTTYADIEVDRFVELDERESNGIRVTIVFDRVAQTASVLVWDERTSASLAIEIHEGDDVYDVFHHPFAYAAFRSDDEPELAASRSRDLSRV